MDYRRLPSYNIFKSSFSNYLSDEKQEINVAAAVSGGADSVCMLLFLKHFTDHEKSEKKINLFVVTVNHHIRPDNESNADALFVEELCKKLSVPFTCIELEKGQVEQLSTERKSGIEEAARYLRYKAFESFSVDNDISLFCLAHNENDWYETALMRIFSGSTSISLKEKRDIFIRPMLNISRKMIEEALQYLKQDFCTDLTNFDDTYFRNNIRKNVVPVLDEKLPVWKKGLKSLSKKIESAGQNLPESIIQNSDGLPYISMVDFVNLSLEQRKNAICILFNENGFSKRVSGPFLNDVCYELLKAYFLKKNYEKKFENYILYLEKNRIFLEMAQKKRTDSGFFDIIKKDGEYSFPFGKIKVNKEENCIRITFDGGTVTMDHDYPFLIRSVMAGDRDKKAIFLVEKI